MKIEELASAGDRKSFPKSVQKYVDKFSFGGPDVAKEYQDIVRYGESPNSFDENNAYARGSNCRYDPAYVNLDWHYVHISKMIDAKMNALIEQEDWEAELLRASSLGYFSALLLFPTCEFQRKKSANAVVSGYNPLVEFGTTGQSIGECMRFGWVEQAHEIAENLVQALKNQDVEDWADVSQCPHQSRSLIAAMLLSSKDKDYSLLEEQINSEELLVWLLHNWNTDDVELLGRRLELLCVRHTHQSRSNSMKHSFEFSRHHQDFDIAEVLSVLRLRQSSGLELPVVEHKLMHTNLGKLIDAGEPELEPSFQKTFDKCQQVIKEYL